MISPAQLTWITRAACAGLHPDLFFPPQGGHGHTGIQAKQICAGCPVRAECLDYAIREQIHHGIWGGTDPTERPRNVKPNGHPVGLPPINHGTEGGYMAHRRRKEQACADCLAEHAWKSRERAHRRGGW